MLTVLSVGYPLAPVSRDAVGGAEQILSLLDEGLVRAGHRSIVVAPAESRVAGELVAIPIETGSLDGTALERAWHACRVALEEVLASVPVDVVHLHGVDFHRYAPTYAPNVMATLHLPPEFYPPEVFTDRRWRLHCVSETQRRACPLGGRLGEVVPNGVPVERLLFSECKDGEALVLGRVCPEKGLHLALEAAHRAGLPLVLGGQVYRYPAHERYFAEEVVPRLDALRRFVGAIDFAGKRLLFARARCLVIPSLVAETSSLVAMEALASGTPVVAFRVGALAEIVEHGRTGLLVEPGDVNGLARAMLEVGSIDPRACRRAAEERFDATRMIERHLTIYERLGRGRVERARSSVMVSRSALTVEHVRSSDELHAISDAWDALCDAVPAAPPFVRPAWLRAWCEFAGRPPMRTLLFRRDGHLVGIAPAYVQVVDGRRRFELLGFGPSDRQDVVALPSVAGEVMRTLLAEIDRMDDVDEAVFEQLGPASPLLDPSLGLEQVETDPCPALRLPVGARTVLEVVPDGIGSSLAYARRRLARLAGVRWVEGSGDEERARLLAACMRLHRARWAVKGERGVVSEEAEQRLHLVAASGLARSGVLELFGLEIDGELVGALYGFRGPVAHAYYLSGFDPAFAKLSIGSLLVGHAIDRAIAAGAETFDFLRGAEPYKYRWGAVDRRNRRLRYVPGGARRATRGGLG